MKKALFCMFLFWAWCGYVNTSHSIRVENKRVAISAFYDRIEQEAQAHAAICNNEDYLTALVCAQEKGNL